LIQPAPQPAPVLDPNRKYLSASNTIFLALKVFGYNVLGYILFFVPLFIIIAIIGALGRGY